MSATMTVPNEVRIMHNTKTTNLSPNELKEIVRKIHALRRVTKTTGFFTSNAIVEVLKPLSTEDLILIGEELKLKPRELPNTPSTQRVLRADVNGNKL
jgi:hypothetical protein